MRTPRHRHTETNLHHHVILTMAAVTVAAALTPRVALAGFEGDIELLRTVAQAYRANYDAIETWQREARIHSIWDMGDSEHQEFVNTVSFAYSQAQNASRWNMRTIQSRYKLDGREMQAPDAGCHAGMLKGDRYYGHITPDSQPEDIRSILQIRKRQSASGEIFESGFDPMYFLTDGSEPHDRRLLFLYENAQNPTMSGQYVITREGNRAQVEESSSTGKNVTRSIYDLSRGGTLVEQYGSFPGGAIRFEYTYEKPNGIWLLKSMAYENRSHQPGPSEDADPIVLTRKKHIEWTTSIVNKPLSPDAFSLARLGIRPGDEVVDRVREIRFAYISDKGIEEPQDATPALGLNRHRPLKRTP